MQTPHPNPRVLDEHEVLAALAALLGAVPGVTFAVRRVDRGDLGELVGVERELAEPMRAPRAAEFATGRRCAHEALASLGLPPTAVGRSTRGRPVWPAGCTGSIAHAGGVAVAVAARTDSAVVRSIGVDLELDGAVEQELWPSIMVPEELAACRDAHHATTVFAAKEAVFKAVHPISGLELEFTDVQLHGLRPGHDAVDSSAAAVAGATFGLPQGWTVGARTITRGGGIVAFSAVSAVVSGTLHTHGAPAGPAPARDQDDAAGR